MANKNSKSVGEFLKNLPIWLKSGVIYTTIVFLLASFVARLIFNAGILGFAKFLSHTFYWPFLMIERMILANSKFLIVVFYILSFIQAFIVGSLIGLLIKKFKKK